MSSHTEDEVATIFRTRGVVTDGHFVYQSGKHGSKYVNKDIVYAWPIDCCRIAHLIATRFWRGNTAHIVVGPAIGGAILAQRVAEHLGNLSPFVKSCAAAFAEKDGLGGFVVKRGYDQLMRGQRVLIVEDVLTTGRSVATVITAVRAVGGDVIGVGAICNRGGVTAEALGVPILESLTSLTFNMWPPDDCPLCQEGMAINTNVGHGKQFLAQQHV